MADILQTPANVIAATGTPRRTGRAGVTIAAGDVLYSDSTDAGDLKLAINSAEATAVVVGIALCGGADGQPIVYQPSGLINPGGTVVVGEAYFCSPNAGKIAPDADVAQNDYRTTIGLGITSSQLDIQIQVSGVAVP